MFLAACIFIGLTVLLFLRTRTFMRKAKELDKYEFENTTSGGVVQFPDHEAALKHRKQKASVSAAVDWMATVMIICGLGSALSLFGLFVQWSG